MMVVQVGLLYLPISSICNIHFFQDAERHEAARPSAAQVSVAEQESGMSDGG